MPSSSSTAPEVRADTSKQLRLVAMHHHGLGAVSCQPSPLRTARVLTRFRA
jgi:hypothetical protein